MRGEDFDYEYSLSAIEVGGVDGKPGAHMVFQSYVRKGGAITRPVTFIWGGGPSGAAGRLQFLWGPKRMDPDSQGPPRILPHEHGVLDRTDLVFIDPVGTGWSVPAGGSELWDFYSVASDGASVAELIKRYLDQNGRKRSPVYLSGRSYGTIRLPVVTHFLRESGIEVSGAVFISSALNGFTAWNASGNLAPFYMKLPNFAAMAWRDKRQAHPAPTCAEAVAEAAAFATGEYLKALVAWPQMDTSLRLGVLTRLEALTGISKEVWAHHHIRMTTQEFKENLNPGAKVSPVDYGRPPKFEDPVNILARTVLGIVDAPLYRGLAPGIYVQDRPGPHPWDTSDFHSFADIDGYLVATFANYYDDMAEAMRANPAMRVQQHSGYYDLGCNSFSTDWGWRTIDIPESQRSNIALFHYEAGHGVSEGDNNTAIFLDNISQFYKI
ncbi:hypothetical protein [Sphingobium sp. AP50]|uniref:hypothetical protein n=1 Tax=Sphingobium sp. AP50 TaxID=1884369 RepID=UPI0011600FC2|nr:hypothetical protein [Sphingobium sp. AP50]